MGNVSVIYAKVRNLWPIRWIQPTKLFHLVLKGQISVVFQQDGTGWHFDGGEAVAGYMCIVTNGRENQQQ